MAFKKNESNLNLILQNHDVEKFSGSIKLGLYSLESGCQTDEKIFDVVVEPNSTDIIFNDCLSEFQIDINNILVASLYDLNLNLVNRNYYVKDKWKYLNLTQTTIKIKNQESLSVETDQIALFVDLFYPGVEFCKRGFILLPNETVKLDYKSKNESKINLESIKIFTLNNYLK